MRKLLLGGVLALMAVSASAEVLWQKAETGMTIQQVKTLFPNAVVDDRGGTYVGGSKSLLHIPNYAIGSNNFDVSFIFDNEKLSLVRMQQISGSPRVGFDTMKTLLIQKYGKPMDYNESTNSLVWVNEGVTIRLANIFDKLVITYKVDTSKEANKL